MDELACKDTERRDGDIDADGTLERAYAPAADPLVGARVYRYGLLPPTVGVERIHASLTAAHRYRNVLTEIERGRRAAVRAVEAEAGLVELLIAHAAADARVAGVAVEIKAHKSANRTAKVPAELRAVHDDAKAARAAATASVREARRRLHEDTELRVKLARIGMLAGELRRSARAFSGLARRGPLHGGYGTYQLVEAAAEDSRAAPLYDSSWAPNDPAFIRARSPWREGIFSGSGSIGVQIQGGLTVDELQTHGLIQIIPLVREQSQSPRRNPANVGKARADSRRAGHRATLRLRVGSADSSGREAVWAEWPMLLDRPLPPDARIMAAAVHVRPTTQRGRDAERWYVTISIRTNAARVPAVRNGAVAINLGWRRVPTGLRVATWVGEDGERGEVIVPTSTLDRLRHSSGIRSLRDELFDLARPWIADIIDACWSPECRLPGWLRTATATLRMWESTERLSDLGFRWMHNRFAGDEAAFEALESWRRRNHHLWQYEDGERRGALGDRKNRFRNAAAQLAARYDRVVHDGVDLTQYKTCPMLTAEADNPQARANMHAGAPGELRASILNAFRGDTDVELGVDITHSCPECGRVEAFDAAIKVAHRCGGCEALWDQDEAAATNLLVRHCERRSAARAQPAAPATVTAEPKESPRARSKRLARERATLARDHAGDGDGGPPP